MKNFTISTESWIKIIAAPLILTAIAVAIYYIKTVE